MRACVCCDTIRCTVTTARCTLSRVGFCTLYHTLCTSRIVHAGHRTFHCTLHMLCNPHFVYCALRELRLDRHPPSSPSALFGATGGSGARPRVSGASPGASGATPGVSGTSPGGSGATPGVSRVSPGESRVSPGESGATREHQRAGQKRGGRPPSHPTSSRPQARGTTSRNSPALALRRRSGRTVCCTPSLSALSHVS